MSRAERGRAVLALSVLLSACDPSAPSDATGACEAHAVWVDAEEPLLVPVRASGALTFDVTAPPAEPLTTTGTLTSAEGTTSTTLAIDTAAGPLSIEIGLPPDALGVLPIGEPVEVVLGDGVALAGADGKLVTAVVSRRGAGEARALSLRFRQEYAECVRAIEGSSCERVVAAPLVDVVTGASVVRLMPGDVWRIPADDPNVEIEILRSVRAPTSDELALLPGAPAPCDEAPAEEIAAVVRHLR